MFAATSNIIHKYEMHHAWKRERHYMYPTTKRTLLGLVSSNRM